MANSEPRQPVMTDDEINEYLQWNRRARRGDETWSYTDETDKPPEDVVKKRVIARDWLDEMDYIGSRYANCTLENYVVYDDLQRKPYQKVCDFAANLAQRMADRTGLVLFGPQGTGKDHLMVACLRIAALRYGFSIDWIDGMTLFESFRDAIKNGDSEGELIDGYCRPNILAISDPVPPFGDVTPYQSQVLFRIIDGRYRRRLPTWCTMNVKSRQEAEDRAGSSTIDRLRDNALAVFCAWPTYREPWGPE